MPEDEDTGADEKEETPKSKKPAKAAKSDEDEESEEEEEEEEEEQPKKKGTLNAKSKKKGDEDDDEPKKKRSPLLLIIIGVVLLFCCLGCGTVGWIAQATIKGFFGIVDAVAKDLEKLNKEKDKEKDVTPEVKGDGKAKEQTLLADYRKKDSKDLPTGAVAVLPSKGELPSAMAFSPTASVLVALVQKKDKPALRRWDLATQLATKEIKFTEDFFLKSALKFSPNGEWLVFSGDSQSCFVKVYKAADLTEVKSIPLQKQQEPVAVAFTADSSRLVAILGDAVEGFQFKMWKTADWQEIPVKIPSEKFRDYLIRPDGNQILALIGGEIVYHDLATGTSLPKKDKYPGSANLFVNTTAISPNHRLIAYTTGAGDGSSKIMLLDLDKNSSTQLSSEKISVLDVYFTPDGKYVAYSTSVGDGSFKLIDIATKQAHPFRSDSFSSTIAFSPGGVFVALTTRDSVMLFALDNIVAGKKK